MKKLLTLLLILSVHISVSAAEVGDILGTDCSIFGKHGGLYKGVDKPGIGFNIDYHWVNRENDPAGSRGVDNMGMAFSYTSLSVDDKPIPQDRGFDPKWLPGSGGVKGIASTIRAHLANQGHGYNNDGWLLADLYSKGSALGLFARYRNLVKSGHITLQGYTLDSNLTQPFCAWVRARGTDSDGDGWSDIDEFDKKTDPNDPDDFPEEEEEEPEEPYTPEEGDLTDEKTELEEALEALGLDIGNIIPDTQEDYTVTISIPIGGSGINDLIWKEFTFHIKPNEEQLGAAYAGLEEFRQTMRTCLQVLICYLFYSAIVKDLKNV